MQEYTRKVCTENYFVKAIWEEPRRDQSKIVNMVPKLLCPIEEETFESLQQDALIMEIQYNLTSAPLRFLPSWLQYTRKQYT